jgi:hypothetical protein
MSEDKFNRWHNFSFRMAKTCYRQRKSPSFTWILATLEQCFEMVKEDGVDCFVSWDNTIPYPKNHNCYGFRDGVPNKPQCLGDWFQECIEYEVWVKPYDFATAKEAKQLDKHNDKADFDKYDQVKEEIVSRVCEPVHCCLRSGLDLVGEQSGGVLGFTVGDLKRMYPEGIPEWITSKFTENLNQAEDKQGVWL